MSLLIRNARVLTLAGPRPRRGPALADLGALAAADVLIEGDRIVAVGTATQATGPGATAAGGSRDARTPAHAPLARGARAALDAAGRVLMPAFIDAHTHACWAGDRLDEWDLKRRGASYLDILAAGGGIMSTVRAVRAAGEADLAANLRQRLGVMLREGTTAAEVKSGYGLTTRDELKMLRAIRAAAADWPGAVVATALLGHALDPDQPDFVRRTIDETLPAVHAEFPGIAVDAYCEKGAWSPEDCLRLFDRAAGLGHPVRVHADQFNALGLTGAAMERGFLSVDHLEATPPDQLAALAASDTYGVMLPCAGFHTDDRYARGRAFADAGGALVIATNCNPGSAPTSSMPFAVALAVRRLGLTPAEAIAAATLNAACLLGLHDRGQVRPGQRADLVLLRHRDERMLAYEFGGNPVDAVVCGGIVRTAAAL